MNTKKQRRKTRWRQQTDCVDDCRNQRRHSRKLLERDLVLGRGHFAHCKRAHIVLWARHEHHGGRQHTALPEQQALHAALMPTHETGYKVHHAAELECLGLREQLVHGHGRRRAGWCSRERFEALHKALGTEVVDDHVCFGDRALLALDDHLVAE